MTRRSIAGTFVVLAVAMLGSGAGLAWACTYQPVMTLRSASPGPNAVAAPPAVTVASQGSEVVVDVSIRELLDGSSPGAVEIRWNALDGAVLASGNGPSLSVPARVPADAAPGVYSIVAVTRDRGGVITNKVSRPIEVAGPAGARGLGAWAQPGTVPAGSASPLRGQLFEGALLLGVGLVALFSGFAALTLGRAPARRAPARRAR